MYKFKLSFINKFINLKYFLILSLISYIKSSNIYAFDLIEAYDAALIFNADYLSQVAQNNRDQEPQNQSRARLLPQLSANTSFNQSYLETPDVGGIGANTGGFDIFHQTNFALNITQVAFDFAKFSEYTKNKYQASVANLSLQNATNNLILSVASAYFDVLYSNDIVLATRSKKTAFEQEMIASEKKFNAGIVNINDYKDATASFDSANAELIVAENDLIDKQNTFKNLTGLNPDLIKSINDQILLETPKPNSLDEWLKIAENNNLSIKITNKQLDMANEDINIQKSGHLPNINLTGQYAYNGSKILDKVDSRTLNNVPGALGSSYSQASVGVVINIPLYYGGLINSKVRESIANYENIKAQNLSIKRKVNQDVINSFWRVYNGVNLVKAQNTALKSAALKLDSDKLAYQLGTRTSIDLVNSQNNYYLVLQKYNKSRYDYLLAVLKLNYDAGIITKQILKEINLNVIQE